MKKIYISLVALLLAVAGFSQQTRIAPTGISDDGTNQVVPMKPVTLFLKPGANLLSLIFRSRTISRLARTLT